jgi:ABC-type dipeptide/oligopeptide/nickel transport system ATPase component
LAHRRPGGPSNGSLSVIDRNLATMDETERAYFRCKQVSFIFQSINLIPTLNIIENIEKTCDMNINKSGPYTFWLFFSVLILFGYGYANEDHLVHNIKSDKREQKIDLIVIHATGGPDCNPKWSYRSGTLASIISHFRQFKDRISIHYIVGRDGEIVKMVDENEIAYHTRGFNDRSIGIELINKGNAKDPYSDKQIKSLIALLRQILDRHQLNLDAIKGHYELDHGYIVCNGKKIKAKQDPGANFPWEKVRNGLICKR